VTSPADARQFLDPRVASRLARLDLVARLVVEGFITGLHKSPYHGFSVEFAEHRPYMPGDPIRHIDWRLYAKSDRFYVKEYEEETNLRAYILLDASASMNYRSSKDAPTKLEYSSYLAAALSYLMLKQQDSVGLLTFSDRVRSFVPPRSTGSHLKILLREIEKTRGGEGTRVGKSLHHLADRIHRRGLIILFSDLLDDPAETLTGLKHFRHRKHEVIVFHVLDPAEIEFPFREETEFIDMESSEALNTLPWEIAREYRTRFREWSERYKRECRENRIDYVQLNTSTPYDLALYRYLEKRHKLI
jgi:uncharacterized protein (DUF58 family)